MQTSLYINLLANLMKLGFFFHVEFEYNEGEYLAFPSTFDDKDIEGLFWK